MDRRPVTAGEFPAPKATNGASCWVRCTPSSVPARSLRGRRWWLPWRERNHCHVDVSVPHDVAAQRIAAATAAGVTLAEDRSARSWWVLADAEGNEACVCT